MATSSWFQNWSPPTQLLPDSGMFDFPVHMRSFRVDDSRNTQLTSSRSTFNIIPYFLSMTILNTKPDANYPPSKNFDNNLPPSEHTGPFKTWYQWSQLDYAFSSEDERRRAIEEDRFIQENNLPLGLEVYENRLFITLPKWKYGIPCTLAVLPKVPKERSPLLLPYPNWEYNSAGCNGLMSVFRVEADSCGRLWVVDSGLTNVSIKPYQECPPKILIFDLHTDTLLLRYELPDEYVKQDSLYSNIIVDVRDGQCDDAFAYIADVWRFGLVVFSLQQLRSWRVTDHLFYPDPFAAAYSLHGLDFEWTDGIFSLALSPESDDYRDRLLYFHPMSSFREFSVKTSIIRNETGWYDSKHGFVVMGESRGKNGHCSASRMTTNGIMFYNLVTKDAVGCWDSRKPYKRTNLGIVAKNSTTFVFPNDLKIDKEKRQSVWVITNKLPLFLYRDLDTYDVNFRVMSAFVDEAIHGTICDPNVSRFDTFDPVLGENECF